MEAAGAKEYRNTILCYKQNAVCQYQIPMLNTNSVTYELDLYQVRLLAGSTSILFTLSSSILMVLEGLNPGPSTCKAPLCYGPIQDENTIPNHGWASKENSNCGFGGGGGKKAVYNPIAHT